MKTVQVPLGHRSYDITIAAKLLTDSARWRETVGQRRTLIVTDTNVAPRYLDQLTGAIGTTLKPCVLPAGESHKTLHTVSNIWDDMMEARLARDDVLVALGGGVVGDMAGFAAACYQRGIACIQVPTTVVSQVDSAVGGKTGVNHPQGKNMIGAFHQPDAVIVDTTTLATLEDAEFRAGLAEVIKYGIILDAEFFGWLETNLDAILAHEHDALAYAIARSCELKATVVASDEKEQGQRALLNLGHTFGHAIETGLGHGAWRHGEAVAAGTVMAAALAVEMNWIDAADCSRIKRLLQRAKLPVWAPEELEADRMLSLMATDKKVQNGQLRLILPHRIGAATVTAEFDHGALRELIASHGVGYRA